MRQESERAALKDETLRNRPRAGEIAGAFSKSSFP